MILSWNIGIEIKITLLLLAAINLCTISTTFAQKARDAKMKVSASKPDAEITVNGKADGNGGAEIKMLANYFK